MARLQDAIARARRRLADSYRFPGFRPLQTVVGVFGAPRVRIVSLVRRSKKWPAECAAVVTAASTTAGAPDSRPAVRRPADLRGAGAVPGRVPKLRCGEARAARFPGRQSPLHQAVRILRREALPLRAHQGHRRGAASQWRTVKELEQQYMREQLRRAGTPGPKVIGLDEVSIRKGHTYRIVVSDSCAGAPSGSAARTAPKRAWMRSSRGSAPRKPRGSGSR